MMGRKDRRKKLSGIGLGHKTDGCPAEVVYGQRIKALDLLLIRLKRNGATLGILKLILILAGLLALGRVFSSNPTFSWGIFGFALTLFIAAAVIHESVIRKIGHFTAVKTINENEMKFLVHEFPETADAGIEFQNSNHSYTADLDIFGEKGLFRYVNRAVTAVGRRCLADWLQSPAGPGEVKIRQTAAAELAQKIDLRQNVASFGMDADNSSRKLDSLYQALDESFVILGKKWLRTFLLVWPMLTVAAAILITIKLSPLFFLFFVLIQSVLNKRFSKQVGHIYGLMSRSGKFLSAYSRVIGEIEAEDFHSEKLAQLKDRLSAGSQGASASIRKLSRLLEWFDARNGMLHVVFNNIFLWDLNCVCGIEKWRKQNAAHIPQWFDSIGEFEALAGLAALHFNNPGWAVPEIEAESFRLEAQNLGHPLIPENERVGSRVELGQKGKAPAAGSLAIVTGPNMAGKSTFLKSVGVNTVLAFAGAPVCAEGFVISPARLITSMKTSDSLDEHLSLFYAELQRLKMILDGLSRGEPVFFLIDEMLKGTNALDRQKGSVALLKQLTRRGANGIVATHDLELTKLENRDEWVKSGGPDPEGIQIANYHFDGYVEGDKLVFDYRLKQGICQSYNALLLMRNMGIDV